MMTAIEAKIEAILRRTVIAKLALATHTTINRFNLQQPTYKKTSLFLRNLLWLLAAPSRPNTTPHPFLLPFRNPNTACDDVYFPPKQLLSDRQQARKC